MTLDKFPRLNFQQCLVASVEFISLKFHCQKWKHLTWVVVSDLFIVNEIERYVPLEQMSSHLSFSALERTHLISLN